MVPFDSFLFAFPYSDFLTRYGNPLDRARWDATRASVRIPAAIRPLLAAFRRRMNVLVLAAGWCSDCAANCPIFERFAELAPFISVRYLDRDTHPDIQNELRINDGGRIPVVVFFSEDGFEVARYGERTSVEYARLVAEVDPALAPRNQPVTHDHYRDLIVTDWFREFHRVQCILRLSPRLRKLHSD
jgi:thiol-disulfide isomerase/thioredoxin